MKAPISALYYPFSEIKSITWLKLAIIYWDEIKRILPPSIVPWDTDALKPFIGEGMVQSVDPTPYLENSIHKFSEQVIEVENIEAVSGRHKNIDEQHTNSKHQPVSAWYLIHRLTHPALPFTVKANPEEIAKYYDNISDFYLRKSEDKILKLLSQKGFIQEVWDDYLDITVEQFSKPKEFIDHLFCCYLASQISSSAKIPLLTDTEYVGKLGLPFLYGEHGSLHHNKDNTFEILAKLDIGFPNPQQINKVPLKKIINFNKKYCDERKHFRIVIEKIKERLALIDDPIAIDDYLSSIRQEIFEGVKDFNLSLNELGISSFDSFLRISCPTLLGGSLSKFINLDPIGSAILAGTGLSIGLLNWYGKFRAEKRKLIKSHDFHYILRLKRINKQ